MGHPCANTISNLVLWAGIFWSSHDNAHRCMSQDLTNDKSTLVQLTAWCHQATSHELSQYWPRSTRLYDVTMPQWVINSSPPSAVYMRQRTGSALVQIMACRLLGAKPLPEPMQAYCQLDSWEHISPEFYHFHSRKYIWNCRLPKWRPFCPGGEELMHMRCLFPTRNCH